MKTVLAGGAVLDVASGDVRDLDVVMEGTHIVELGRDLRADTIVPCHGNLIVPGFIDCHSHVALGEQLGNPAANRLPRSALALSVVPVLQTLMSLGITTVRDAWGADAGIRLALERGWIAGPDLRISLRQLSTTGGIGDHWSPQLGSAGAWPDPSLPDPVFDGPDGARAAVRRMVRAGADWIKVAATGSLSQGARAHDVLLTAAEMEAIVDEAARQGGRRVMVHAHGSRAAELAAQSGARSIEHGIWLNAQAVDTMARSGTWFVPTLSVTQTPSDHPVPGAAEAHRRAVRLALDAGVDIAMGTDSPVRPFSAAPRELEYLDAAGLGAGRAFRAATLDAARLLSVDADRGEVVAGKRADLIVLRGRHVDTKHLATRVVSVWHNGRRVESNPEGSR